MFKQIIVIGGILLNSIGTLAYIIDTLKGKVKPNKITYFMWSIAPFVAFAAQLSQKVRLQSLMTLSVGIFPFSVFIASFINKNADWQIRKFDLVCGFFSFIGLILWYITKIGNIAILFSIIADLLATTPTIIKGYRYPETELGWPWLLASASGLLTLISIDKWNFQYYAFPLYYFIAMTLLFILIQFKIGKKFKLDFER